MQYGNPEMREHYFAMQNITVDDYLPAVACPHDYLLGYDSQYIKGL
jgi:mannan endo-1,4-beta-mannosidase